MLGYLIVILISLAIQFILAMKFVEIADEKGHSGHSYFWVCFLLGMVGYVMVAALPDRSLHHLMLTELGDAQMSHETKKGAFYPERSKLSNAAVPAKGWRCTCGRTHQAYETSCVCGISKSDVTLAKTQQDT